MKYILLFFVAISMLIVSCTSNGQSGVSQEKDSLQLVADSFQNVDIKLSFKGLTIGDSLKPNPNGLYGTGFTLSAINEYSYQERTGVSFIDDGKERTEYPTIQVDVLDGRIVRISVLTDSWGLCKFFIDTFNDRYYKKEPITSGNSGVYTDYYGWFFKEQNISIRRTYHKDAKHGIYNITDAALIEYENTQQCRRLDAIFEEMDSVRAKEKEMKIDEDTKRFRDNI